MTKFTEMRSSQQKFFHAYVRRTLINWCAQGLANGDGTFTPVLPDDLPVDDKTKEAMLDEVIEYARKKGWVSKTDLKMLTKSYTTAAGMMKIV